MTSGEHSSSRQEIQVVIEVKILVSFMREDKTADNREKHGALNSQCECNNVKEDNKLVCRMFVSRNLRRTTKRKKESNKKRDKQLKPQNYLSIFFAKNSKGFKLGFM